MNKINEVHSLYLPTYEIALKAEEVANATAIPTTLKPMVSVMVYLHMTFLI